MTLFAVMVWTSGGTGWQASYTKQMRSDKAYWTGRGCFFRNEGTTALQRIVNEGVLPLLAAHHLARNTHYAMKPIRSAPLGVAWDDGLRNPGVPAEAAIFTPL